MNSEIITYSFLLPGIQFILGLQLVLIACIHFIYPSRRNTIPLGLLCLIHGLWFFKRVFHGFWDDNLFLFILIGPGKPIFVGALLLFYYKLYSSKLTRAYLLSHLVIPSLYYILLITFRFFLKDSIPLPNYVTSMFFTLGVFFIFWYYFFLTRKELITNAKRNLIPKAYKKVMLLFYSLYFFLLQVPIWDMLKNIVLAEVLPQNLHEKIAFLYNKIFVYIGEFSAYTYLHLLGYFLFLYALSEVSFFKQLFLPQNALLHQNTLKNRDQMDRLIHQFFTIEKSYKNPELSLASCAKSLNIVQKELIDYLKLTNRGVFKDFVNQLRVDEFKSLVKNEQFVHYDLVGLAKECGFKSKSTFFRVFKKLEGITPNQYKSNTL